MPVKEFEAYPTLKYWTKVRTPLFEIITTIATKVDRDLRDELRARSAGTPLWLLIHVRVARHTWEVVEALANGRKELALGLEIAVAIPPLARVICESLFSIAFVFEDVSQRLPWFWKSTW